MTNANKQTGQFKQKLEVLGWLIALETVNNGFLRSMFPQFMSITAVIWFDIMFYIFLYFCDRNLLKTQDGWEKKKIAWGWFLFTPVYLYKRARLLKESLLKFWICLVSAILIMIHGYTQFKPAPAIESITYEDCAYELGRYVVDKDKVKDICLSKQVIFNQCVDNLMNNGTNPDMIMDICKERVSTVNMCAVTISGAGISIDTALEFCICVLQNGKQHCLEKYGFVE